jgi:hypothetical protein
MFVEVRTAELADQSASVTDQYSVAHPDEFFVIGRIKENAEAGSG